ncbi:MAG: sel1 repeat family protein [Clostridia bacterium]|nr:sel1 repeat family protein [Clostridia bacterium]
MPFDKNAADVLFMRGEYEKAREMFLMGAEEGSEIAAYNYAYCLLGGYGGERDPALAKSFFTFARDMEGGESCYNLAVMYLDGVGVERDLRQALAYMTDAAELGSVEAMLYLGMCYTLGYMLYPDITGICMIPYHKPEMRLDGVLMLEGDMGDIAKDEEERSTVVRQDQRRAFEYFAEAATADPTYVEDLVAKGRFLFARCFIDGLGTDINRNVGMQLMLSAGKLGSVEAVAFLAENGVDTRQLAEFNVKPND